MTINFKKIDKTNYQECIKLTVSDNQKNFVATNEYSLVQVAYEEGLLPLGIYKDNKMVGFILYDFDEDISGWSMSRFMIDIKYQNNGIGKEALLNFIDFFKLNHGNENLYTSAEVDNIVAIKLYEKMGFEKQDLFEYTHNNKTYKEIRMLKKII